MAIWVKSLITRIDKARDSLDQMDFINKWQKHELHDKSVERYQILRQQLDDHISGQEFANWTKSIAEASDRSEMQNTEQMIDKALGEYFLRREQLEDKNEDLKAKAAKDKKPDAKDGKKKKEVLFILKNNFNTKLLKILIEVQYWNKLQSVVTIPHTLHKLVGDSERLRVLRENVMLTVRDYNQIVVLIDERERKLFEEHLGVLNKAYDLGFKKHNWNFNQDAFIMNCRKECKIESTWIRFFQGKHRKIEADLQRISATVLINIQKKVYDLSAFIHEQKKEMKRKMEGFQETFERIRSELYEMYEQLFINKGTDIQREWLLYIEKLDKALKKALTNSVKQSLHEL